MNDVCFMIHFGVVRAGMAFLKEPSLRLGVVTFVELDIGAVSRDAFCYIQNVVVVGCSANIIGAVAGGFKIPRLFIPNGISIDSDIGAVGHFIVFCGYGISSCFSATDCGGALCDF